MKRFLVWLAQIAMILLCGWIQSAADGAVAPTQTAAPSSGQSVVVAPSPVAPSQSAHTQPAPTAQIPARSLASATARNPVLISRRQASFASMCSDPDMQRIMAADAVLGRFAVFNTTSGDIRDVPTGVVNAIAVDPIDDKIFVAGEGEKVIVFDRLSMVRIDEIDLPGFADAITFDPDADRLFVGHDGSTELWVIDAKTHQLVDTVKLDGIPSFAAYDPSAARLYQTVDGVDRIDSVDPATDRVAASWAVAPAVSPRGIAVDPPNHLAFVAGINGLLVVLDTRTGAVIGSAPIASVANQIAFDSQSREVFCASGSAGVVSVVRIDSAGIATNVGDIATHPGAQALALAHGHSGTDIWVGYTTPTGSYLQAFSPSQQSAAR